MSYKNSIVHDKWTSINVQSLLHFKEAEPVAR